MIETLACYKYHIAAFKSHIFTHNNIINLKQGRIGSPADIIEVFLV